MCAIYGFFQKDLHQGGTSASLTEPGPGDGHVSDPRDAVRLAVLSPAGHHGPDGGGDAAFELDGDYVVCNGEIYGFRP